MKTAIAKTIPFNSKELLETAMCLDDKTHSGFEVTPAQFRAIENLTSSSGLTGDLQTAISWLEGHAEELHQEALKYEEQGDGYCLPMGHCAYFTDCETAAIYKTTSGTILAVIGEDCTIALPNRRRLGFHHRIISLILGGLSFEEIDCFDNLHLLEGVEYQHGVEQRKEKYDPILIPMGYEPQKSWESVEARIQEKSLEKSLSGEEGEEFDYDGNEDFDFDYGGDCR